MEQCDDSITEVEALRKYSDYKTKFETQQLRPDVSTNEEEEWMVVEEWRYSTSTLGASFNVHFFDDSTVYLCCWLL